MTFLAPTGSQWRTPEIGKNVIVSPWRGITRVQSWPKKRGLPTDGPARTQLIFFKAVQAIIKWLTPHETEYIREAIKEHNRTHRGQRGSAAIRLRDWQTQRIMGRGIAVVVSPQLTFYPPAVARDASLILDWVAPFPGQILQRTGQQWEAIPSGDPGDVLTAGGPGQPNSWQPEG